MKPSKVLFLPFSAVFFLIKGCVCVTKTWFWNYDKSPQASFARIRRRSAESAPPAAEPRPPALPAGASSVALPWRQLSWRQEGAERPLMALLPWKSQQPPRRSEPTRRHPLSCGAGREAPDAGCNRSALSRHHLHAARKRIAQGKRSQRNRRRRQASSALGLRGGRTERLAIILVHFQLFCAAFISSRAPLPSSVT